MPGCGTLSPREARAPPRKGYTMEENQAVAENVALEEFERILRAARIKWNLYVQVEGRDGELDKEIIVDAIKDGRVSVNDDGFPTIHTENSNDKLKTIHLRRFTDADMLAADRVKAAHDGAKMNAILGKWTGIDAALISLLESRDKRLLERLWSIFLGY